MGLRPAAQQLSGPCQHPGSSIHTIPAASCRHLHAVRLHAPHHAVQPVLRHRTWYERACVYVCANNTFKQPQTGPKQSQCACVRGCSCSCGCSCTVHGQRYTSEHVKLGTGDGEWAWVGLEALAPPPPPPGMSRTPTASADAAHWLWTSGPLSKPLPWCMPEVTPGARPP